MGKTTKQSLGGKARAEVLTPKQRKTIASEAAKIRWENDAKLPKAEYRGEIVIGDIRIPCAVLEDGTRLLTQEGFLKSIGRSGKPAKGRGSVVEKVAPFLALDNLKPFVNADLESSTFPIIFRPVAGSRAYGYKAELLPKVCEVYLKARDKKVLLKSQIKFAKACDILMRGLAHVGIIALVDEATGYQKVRQRRALEKILENFIADELIPWTKRFPDTFYNEIVRLKKWGYRPDGKYPSVVGHYTNNFVYARLAPGILDELRRLTPKDNKGRRKNRFHQWLNEDIGHPVLQEHLTKVVTLMQASTSWEQFKNLADRVIPKYGEYPLPLDLSEDVA